MPFTPSAVEFVITTTSSIDFPIESTVEFNSFVDLKKLSNNFLF